MLIGVNCLKCGKFGRARFMRGEFGISYTAWLCPDCRKEWKASGLNPKEFLEKCRYGR